MKKQARKWMDRHVNDPFVKRAKIQAFRSRAAFKLKEIDEKHQLLKQGMKVIDFGASPGGWSQVIAEAVKSKKGSETVVAVDLIEMLDIEGVKFIHGDIESEEVQDKVSKALNHERADMVCSDAVPDFVGDRFIDHMKATYLNSMVLQFCNKHLRPGGTLLMKIIQGPAESELVKSTLKTFQKSIRVKPMASRSESAEIYLLCTNFGQSEDPEAIKMREIQKNLQRLGKAA